MNPQPAAAMPHDDLIRLPRVCERLGGICKATLYRGIRRGKYPAPVIRDPGMSYWSNNAITAHIEARKAVQAERETKAARRLRRVGA